MACLPGSGDFVSTPDSGVFFEGGELSWHQSKSAHGKQTILENDWQILTARIECVDENEIE